MLEAGAKHLPQVLTPENQHRRPLHRRPSRRTGEKQVIDQPALESSRGRRGIDSIQNQRISSLFFCFIVFYLLPPPSFLSFLLLLFFLLLFFYFLFLFFFLFSLFLLFPIQFAFSQSALNKMTRSKNSPQKKESETVLSPKSYKIGITIHCQKANPDAQL